ncbi:nitrate- and nitrite sensing domain-containing protein [Cupriavidus agavae]|uniref:Response regulator receiver and ANTAR domain protein n=1 Tax=Cupriavidus agavae TaxID=1001822 RepID=A0A4Q7RFW8_9BURK|nr:nitrate- and nitrite sensing domain-containing protein [Cupriavidus agavae]RZT30772.1 response regulator receiver and ANTAR domain protein [Cupriavidus agavae]
MALSASQLVLHAKQLEIEAVRLMASRVDLADLIGQLIHALQRERGASSVFLASGGQRLATERAAAMDDSMRLEQRLAERFAAQLDASHKGSASMVSLMAWVQLDLATLAGLRASIACCQASALDAVAGFSRLIAALLELIFHLADVAMYPGISRPLVALVYLLQGKEAAGQERAVGAQMFASGICAEIQQQRVLHLVEAQRRSFRVLEQFADPPLLAAWQRQERSPAVADLEQMRHVLLAAAPGSALDAERSERWFGVCSQVIAGMWRLQGQLVQELRAACEAEIRSSQADLQDSAGLLRRLLDNPPPHTHAVELFFDAAGHPDAAPVLPGMPDGTPGSVDAATVASLKGLLQKQASRLTRTEVELDAARRALKERKVIERAKTALMARTGMSEDAAFRTLQKASMDNNRRLADVAEATLALGEIALPARGGTHHD